MKRRAMVASRLAPPLFVLALILTASFPGYSQEKVPPADAVAQRFFAHLDRNQPVAGIFEIDTTIDFSQIKASVDQKRKARYVPEPSKQTLICRWAWMDNHEVCEQLEGSECVPKNFLALPQGTLIGYPKDKYNLFPPGKPRANVTRPALFYYLNGGTFWSQYLASAKYSLESMKGQNLSGAVHLIAMDGPRKNILTVGLNTGKLFAAEIYHDGKKLWELSINEFATNPDGRLFPSKAKTSVYGNDPDKPFRTATLTARRVEFPTMAEVAKQFKLSVPAKSLIADRVLNAAIQTTQPMEASEIITGDTPRKPFATPAALDRVKAPSRFRLIVTAILLTAPVMVYVIRSVVRRLHARHVSPPPPPNS